MATYLAPGVYVEEVPSGSAPIAGAGTSTAGFIGVIPKEVTGEEVGIGDGNTTKFTLSQYPVKTDSDSYTVKVNNVRSSDVTIVKKHDSQQYQVIFSNNVPPNHQKITVDYKLSWPFDEEKSNFKTKVQKEKVGTGDGTKKTFPLKEYPVVTDSSTFTVKVGTSKVSEVSLENDDTKQQSQVKFDTAPGSGEITVDYQPSSLSVGAGKVELVTNFGEFKRFFGDFSKLKGQNTLAHAVYGFLRNGGTRCYVTWVTSSSEIGKVLDDSFGAIDEIAIVAAPGVTDKTQLTKIGEHCKKMGDRVAIFDGPETDANWASLQPGTDPIPGNSDYAALYFPWIEVYDPASQANKYVPPSGHVAGIYARVDAQRGVHKAPGNETVLGATGLKYSITKNKQDGLNPQGINCIRDLNGNIRVWGARTLGGNANGEFKYINVRRLLNFLRESIDEGTQWAVFEPNSPALWAKIQRNVTAFLTNVWRSGALFGATPAEAFYVKCDPETNPPELRDLGQVVTEIGVAVVKPAEFVIFRISQQTGAGSS